MNFHEEQFARVFILPGKQERYLSMLPSPTGRARLLAKFPHCKDLNMKYATLVPAGQQNANAIAKALANKGAPDLCHVISADPDIDNREMPLDNALEETVGMNMGPLSLVSQVSWVISSLKILDRDISLHDDR